MSVDYIINILYRHLQMNDLIEDTDAQLLMNNNPKTIYKNTVYRCIVSDKVVKNDLWQSWTKDKQMAYEIVTGLRGGYIDGDIILLEQNGYGIDLVKLLRILKNSNNISQDKKKIICKLLTNYKHEQEVLCKLNDTYKIIEVKKC